MDREDYNKWIDFYRSLKVTSQMRKKEYSIWRDNFPSLNFLSKSRLGKIWGPIMFFLDFHVEFDKLTYMVSPLLVPISRASNELGMFTTGYLKSKHGSALQFMYYPFNEDNNILNLYYRKNNFKEPYNEKEKLTIIRNLELAKVSIEGDLALDQLTRFLKYIETTNDLSNEKHILNHMLISLYANLYLNFLQQSWTIYHNIVSVSKGLYNKYPDFNVSKFLELIESDLTRRSEYLHYMNEVKADKKYVNAVKAEIKVI